MEGVREDTGAEKPGLIGKSEVVHQVLASKKLFSVARHQKVRMLCSPGPLPPPPRALLPERAPETEVLRTLASREELTHRTSDAHTVTAVGILRKRDPREQQASAAGPEWVSRSPSSQPLAQRPPAPCPTTLPWHWVRRRPAWKPCSALRAPPGEQVACAPISHLISSLRHKK